MQIGPGYQRTQTSNGETPSQPQFYHTYKYCRNKTCLRYVYGQSVYQLAGAMAGVGTSHKMGILRTETESRKTRNPFIQGISSPSR